MAEGFQHQGERLQMVKAKTRNVENDPGIPVKSSLPPRVSRAGDFEMLGGVLYYEKPQNVLHGDIVVKK
jgi:hypothetical protein